jgi:hypothetical protein
MLLKNNKQAINGLMCGETEIACLHHLISMFD